MPIQKMAIFVEGQTELIFIYKLIIEIAGNHNVEFQEHTFNPNNRCPEIKRFTDTNAKYKIYLYNSCGDKEVLSTILENYQKLQISGFKKILGLRDIYRKDRNNYPKKERIQNQINSILEKNKISNTKIVLSIMEIETWFIADLTHYPKIDTRLTLDYIRENLIDLENILDFEKEVAHPAQKLDEIYFLVKKHWSKKEKGIKKTIDILDYENFYFNLKNEIPSLNKLILELDEFFID